MASEVVSISYEDLISSPHSLSGSIVQKRHSGLVQNVLGLSSKLLKLSYEFAHLEESVREKYADARSRYSFGWSHGKEIMNGKPDVLKGSFYANPVVDDPDVAAELREEYPEYYNRNIWPKADEAGVEGYEQAFKQLGGFIFEVGCALATACEAFATPHLNVSISNLIKESSTAKARLLHYFPPPTADSGRHPAMNPILTGLCSAMYLREGASGPEIVPSPSESSGLYIRTRGGTLTKVSIPTDCLAFQTGEALEVATGLSLRATPHCVRVGMGSGTDKISRETLAVFMQPNVDQQLSDKLSFGQFSKQVFSEHYEDESK
ncbi:Clavaminate synthase-like protein [Roridomyces roridus]|uniref:Clavaminate synthase-like protein n=1 Tax=Roridomyces roridus TaxID=1738132 RepID=A0AAD7BUP3_9AGAR|nr:Clavaminate synthase-like protein [Roridomyces roridus]